MTSCVAPSRRDWLVGTAAAAALPSGCSRSPRHEGWLNYLLGTEPNTLDPALCFGGTEICIMAAIFEPLIQPHPETMQPMAGLATHYSVDRGGTRYTFYLRGHRAPQGVELPGIQTLGIEFSRGRTPASCHVPAKWSDGRLITADDLVYSWRRYLAPDTANSVAYLLYCVNGAEPVNSGKASVESLGVRALDAFTFQVDLQAPASYFPLLCSCFLTLALPRHAIEAARKRGDEASWVNPRNIVTSGPFLLVDSRPREYALVRKNPAYFDADLVGLAGIRFMAVDGVVALNMYRAGVADSMEGHALPLQLASRVRRMQGFHGTDACASYGWRIGTRVPPLDNVRARYALNMATDKEATVRFLGAGQRPAVGRVPPIAGYVGPASLPVEINGRNCDVLSFNPRAARELWAATVTQTHAPIPIHYMARTDSTLIAEILQYQWQQYLGLETRLNPLDQAAYIAEVLVSPDWTGVGEDPYICNYPDPVDILNFYTANYPGWSDPEYNRMVAEASSALDPALRLQKLRKCETRLLRGMPCIPLYYDTWNYLERPEVRGLRLTGLNTPSFKYTWIDAASRVQ
jgi:oligopeptide transport system substrate-binding protein